MAGISSAGIGSGLDVPTLVAQLVANERAPTAALIDRSERQTKAQISALATLRNAFDGLRTALTKLTSDDSALARKVSVQAEAGFSASAAAGAATGNYQVEVLALATAHKLSSAAYAKSDTAVGTGQLTIVSGETTINVTIGDDDNTLAGIRDAINRAADGKGVTATIVNADDGAHLVLSATQSGAANALRITTSGGDGGLAGLRNDPPNATTMTQLSAAADARVKIDGLVRSSASNTITDMLQGVTLTLTKAAVGTVKELSVASDPAALRNAAKGFVTAYNASLGAITTTSKYDPATKIAAAFNGDAMVRGTGQDLRNQISGSVTDLKALGITIAADGTLKMDDAAFDAAIAKDPAPASRLFAADNSLASGLQKSLSGLLEKDGLLDSRSSNLAGRTSSIEDQRTALDRRMSQVEARYRAQFVALDGLMSKMQSTSSFLSQQLALL
ncbi:MAG TPA: flagellar filament capping protein FliD [Lysobacter sp.]